MDGAKKTNAEVPPSDRLAFRAKEVAMLLGISERKLREVQGALPRVHVGGVVLFPRRALEQWLEREAKSGDNRVDEAVDEALEALMDSPKG